jgi:hypothetical protein
MQFLILVLLALFGLAAAETTTPLLSSWGLLILAGAVGCAVLCCLCSVCCVSRKTRKHGPKSKKMQIA